MQLQLALAIEILLVAPMRLRNLSRLELGRHLQQAGRGRNSHWAIVIPGEEVKNGQPIELPLPERSVQLSSSTANMCSLPSRRPATASCSPARMAGPRPRSRWACRSRGCSRASSACG